MSIQLVDVESTSASVSTINCLETPMPSTSSAIHHSTNEAYSIRSTRSQKKSVASTSSGVGQSTSRLITRSQKSTEMSSSIIHQSTSYGSSRSGSSRQLFSTYEIVHEDGTVFNSDSNDSNYELKINN